VGVPIQLTTDAAFLIEAETPSDLDLSEHDEIQVGLTVRRWFRRESDQLRYEQVLASFVDWLIAARRARAIFVPQVTHTLADDDDRTVARRIVGRMKHPDGALLLDRELRPGEIKDLCGRMTYFVGTRMHSAIFALSMGVPVLAIGYLPKTAGLMEELGLSEWTLPIESLEDDKLRHAYDRLVARGQDLRAMLSRQVPKLTAAALRNGRSVEEAFLRWRRARAEP
jgi:colanic acid/amylovoran biosynthesis protein